MRSDPYIVFYDGQCRICRRGAQSLRRMAPRADLRFISIADAPAMARYPQIDRTEAQGQMFVLDPRGEVSGGYDALVTLAPLVPPARPVAPLLRWPPLRRLGWSIYRWIARNRYRISGQRACDENGACRMPG